MAMMEPVQVGMKQRDGPLVKRIRHRRPLFFSSFGRIGMPCFSLMVKRNGACQHAGNEGAPCAKARWLFPEIHGLRIVRDDIHAHYPKQKSSRTVQKPPHPPWIFSEKQDALSRSNHAWRPDKRLSQWLPEPRCQNTLLSALSRKENGHPLPNGQHKTRCLSCDAREIYRKAMPSPIAGMDLTYGLPSVGRRAEILYIMVLFFLKFYHKLLFV